MERYDVSRNKWIDTPAMSEGRVCAAGIVFKGCLYVFGGESRSGRSSTRILKSVERFDPAIGKWQSLPPMSEARHFRSMAQYVSIAAVGDHLYVCDGMVADITDQFLNGLTRSP